MMTAAPYDTCSQCRHAEVNTRKDDYCWGILPIYVEGAWHRKAPIDASWPACASFQPKQNA